MNALRSFASIVRPKRYPKRDDRICDDRVEILSRQDRALEILVADGATGSGDGWRAAGILADAFLQRPASDTPEWTGFLCDVDAEIRAQLMGWADTTGIVMSISDRTVLGASAGDSMAYLVGPSGWREITAGQSRKPRLGNFANPRPFEADIDDARWLIVATDGLWDQASRDSIRAIVEGTDEPARLVEALVDHVVASNQGQLRDDLGIAAVLF